jgi:hypothetical protein
MHAAVNERAQRDNQQGHDVQWVELEKRRMKNVFAEIFRFMIESAYNQKKMKPESEKQVVPSPALR